MSLTKKETKVKRAMRKQYGAKKGEQVFYASVNKGKLGTASKKRHQKRNKRKR